MKFVSKKTYTGLNFPEDAARMNRKYASLRLESLKNGLPAAALLLAAQEAEAANVTLSSSSPIDIHAGSVAWRVSNSTSATSNSSYGLGIQGGQLAGVQGQAFDGSFVMTVNGTVFYAPHGVVDLTGTTLTATSQMSGLTVTAQFYFDPNSPTVRVVYTYTNPTGAPIHISVQWQNYLGVNGSGGGPGIVSGHTAQAAPRALALHPRDIVATSSGDTIESAADHWVITNISGQPYIDMVRYGPGATITPTAIQAPSSTNGLLVDQYNITVPAGQARGLMFFARLSANQGAAVAGSSAFNSTGSLGSLLTGVTPQQQANIVNWYFPQTTPTVPALGMFPLLLLAGLMAAMGARYLRRPVAGR